VNLALDLHILMIITSRSFLQHSQQQCSTRALLKASYDTKYGFCLNKPSHFQGLTITKIVNH